ncbi:MAG TPA: isochorismatase family cysteine hydrolase [Chloroflexaceae bacterium]|nr:isochorismatase family cysteine hydrolase [Chloroflexaceae bacterium]
MATTTNMHGGEPQTAPAALLLIDVINDLEFPGGEALLPRATAMAAALAGLKARARRAGLPCIYVNDNFGRWRSDFRQTAEHVLAEGRRGRPVAELLRPDDDDYFVLKPQHSGFYGTALELLLKHLGARALILGGMAANICVLATATDAYMRDFRLYVPADGVAAEGDEQTAAALAHMADVLKADTTPTAELDLEAVARGDGSGEG